MNDAWYKVKLITIITVFLLVIAAGYGVYMYANKVSESVAKKMVQRQRIIDEETEPIVALKDEYSNPLDQDTQYSNPFDRSEEEYQNPFDSTTQ